MANTSKQKIADSFNEYFTSIGPKLAYKIDNPSCKSFKNFLKHKPRTKFIFKTVSESDVKNAFADLKPKNSCGYDELSSKMLKSISHCLIEPFTLIANQCLTKGIFPDHFKTAEVLPLYRKGDSSDFSNYRPISLLTTFSKVLEKLIYKQLSEYFLYNNLFFSNQYGFRPGHSTELAVLHAVDLAIKDLEKGLVPLYIYIDLSKAFDTLDHAILLEKLSYYGLQGRELSFFIDYLSNRLQFVTYDKYKFVPKKLTTGV